MAVNGDWRRRLCAGLAVLMLASACAKRPDPDQEALAENLCEPGKVKATLPSPHGSRQAVFMCDEDLVFDPAALPVDSGAAVVTLTPNQLPPPAEGGKWVGNEIGLPGLPWTRSVPGGAMADIDRLESYYWVERERVVEKNFEPVGAWIVPFSRFGCKGVDPTQVKEFECAYETKARSSRTQIKKQTLVRRADGNIEGGFKGEAPIWKTLAEVEAELKVGFALTEGFESVLGQTEEVMDKKSVTLYPPEDSVWLIHEFDLYRDKITVVGDKCHLQKGTHGFVKQCMPGGFHQEVIVYQLFYAGMRLSDVGPEGKPGVKPLWGEVYRYSGHDVPNQLKRSEERTITISQTHTTKTTLGSELWAGGGLSVRILGIGGGGEKTTKVTGTVEQLVAEGAEIAVTQAFTVQLRDPDSAIAMQRGITFLCGESGEVIEIGLIIMPFTEELGLEGC